MSKKYIKNPSEAPKGTNVQRGSKGGYYYEDDGSSKTPTKHKQKQSLEHIISAGNDHGYVKDNVYTNLSGEKFKRNDEIDMHFMGKPNEMPKPWTLINAKNHTSHMNNTVEVQVEAANGKKMTFKNVHYYSPHKPSHAETMIKIIKLCIKN